MLKKGLQLCSRSPVSLRRTDKRTSRLPGSLRPSFGKGRVLARLGRAGETKAFLSTTKFLRPEFTTFIAL